MVLQAIHVVHGDVEVVSWRKQEALGRSRVEDIAIDLMGVEAT